MTLRWDQRSRVSTYTQSWVTNADPDFGVFESIATTVLSSSTGTVTFSSIPQTYKHLQLRVIGKTDRALNRDSFRIRFNSDSTTTNYRSHFVYGNGASTASSDEGDTAGGVNYRLSGNSGATDIFGASIVDVLDYSNTNKYKTTRCLGGADFNGADGEMYLGSAVWLSSSAITSFTIVPNTGTNFLQYSHFALYGIKG
jgi:hypothetical protein